MVVEQLRGLLKKETLSHSGFAHFSTRQNNYMVEP